MPNALMRYCRSGKNRLDCESESVGQVLQSIDMVAFGVLARPSRRGFAAGT